jgi:salicylate hydroxylase
MDVRSGLADYSQKRVARATRVQIEAQRQGRIYHLSGPLALARNAALRILGGSGLRARYDWLYGA